MFTKFNPSVISETFKEFESNRAILSKKLSGLNPYQGGVIDPNDPNYFKGYGRYAQDVVIPAFLAAYSKKDPTSIKLTKNSNPNLRSNPFSGIIPKPNWTVTYTGLSRLRGMDKIFTNFSIRHGYHSTFSMNSFNTALLFTDPNRVGYPFFRDTLTGNYIPYFLVPNITIQEAFDPLIEIDMTFTNQLTARFEFKKSRQLSFSLIDYHLAGQKVIRIAPSIDYILNNRVSMKLYFEQTRNIPKISNSFPITNTRGGLQIRISLTQ